MAAGDEIYLAVQTELQSLSIDTQPEVADFRIPGERRINLTSPTAGDMNTVLSNVATSLKNRFVSRKRVRRDALRLLKEGGL